MLIYSPIILSVILAFSLELSVQQGFWLWVQPEWVVLALCYWLIYQPRYFGMGACFFMGLAADVVHGSLLGQHALIYLCLGFFIINSHRRISLYQVWKLALIIFLLTLAYLIFTFLLSHSMVLIFSTAIFSLPLKALTTTLLWVLAAQLTQVSRLSITYL